MKGTLINAGAVLVGSTIGLLIHKRMPKRLMDVTFQVIGLFTCFLGLYMAFKINDIMLMIFSLLIGSIFGELINLDKWMQGLGDSLKNKLKVEHETFTEGLVTAFLIFCIGSMTFLGALEEGLGKSPRLLLTKSILDGFTSIALASSLGIGVLFSVLPLLIFQGGLTLLAMLAGDIIPQALVTELTAVGGILILGIGINILELKKLKILNMTPSLLATVALYYLFKFLKASVFA